MMNFYRWAVMQDQGWGSYAIAALPITLHHCMEKLITNMLVSKNNRVRLEAARRTIEELEARPTDTNAS